MQGHPQVSLRSEVELNLWFGIDAHIDAERYVAILNGESQASECARQRDSTLSD